MFSSWKNTKPNKIDLRSKHAEYLHRAKSATWYDWKKLKNVQFYIGLKFGYIKLVRVQNVKNILP